MNSVRLANKLYHPVLALAVLSIAIQILCLILRLFSVKFNHDLIG